MKTNRGLKAIASAQCLLYAFGMAWISQGAPAAAQPPVRSDQNEGQVAVGGRTILTIRVPSEGMTIRQRAEAVTDRLAVILADPDLKPSDIFAVPLGRTAAKIMVKNQLLVTVDPQTARINQAKPLELAQAWVSHLRRVLPSVNVKPNPNNGEPARNNESDQTGAGK